MSYKHTCIKPGCGKQYDDEDPDPYYCTACNEQRLVIAQAIEAKYPVTVGQPKSMSDLEIYDSQAKTMNSPTGRLVTFAPAKL